MNVNFCRTANVLVLFLLGSASAYAAAHPIGSQFMSSRDMIQGNVYSNVYLKNSGTMAKTVYGLYIREFGYVTPGDTCDHATSIYPSLSIAADNVTAGANVSPVTIAAGNSATIGSNHLYNMIYQANYYVNINIPSSPAGCALPGCTWGSDTNQYNWCIKLGALGPSATSPGYTATVPPSAVLASDSGYDYNMIAQYVVIGPVACDDQAMSCVTATRQTQAFP